MNVNLLRSRMVSHRDRSWLDRLLPAKSHKGFRKHSVKVVDEFFFTALSSLDVKYLMECGAHEASASARFATFGEKSLAIEANPLTFKHKTKLVASDKVTTLNIGLGPKNDTLEFFVPCSDTMAGHATFQPRPNEIYQQETVDVTTMDSLWQAHFDAEKKIALWIDVEGFTREVLSGGHALLSSPNCVLIKVEVETFPYFANQALCSEVVAIFTQYGFEVLITDDETADQFNLILAKSAYIDDIANKLTQAYIQMSEYRLTLPRLLKLCL